MIITKLTKQARINYSTHHFPLCSRMEMILDKILPNHFYSIVTNTHPQRRIDSKTCETCLDASIDVLVIIKYKKFILSHTKIVIRIPCYGSDIDFQDIKVPQKFKNLIKRIKNTLNKHKSLLNKIDDCAFYGRWY